MGFVQILSLLDSFRQGTTHKTSNLNFLFGLSTNTLTCRLTAAKEQGANIVIDGKTVALGIPGGGKQIDTNKPIPGIPLGRGATPDEAAKSVLL